MEPSHLETERGLAVSWLPDAPGILARVCLSRRPLEPRHMDLCFQSSITGSMGTKGQTVSRSVQIHRLETGQGSMLWPQR